MASETTALPAPAPDAGALANPGAPVAPQKIVRPRSGLAEFLEMLLVTMLLALFGTTFVVQAFKIPSGSMEPTLLIGDHVFVNKFIFEGTGAWCDKFLPYRDIRRGDIIVFKFPYDDHPHYVKRVIGLPGERLRIVNGGVYVNGELLREPYVVRDPAYQDPYGETFRPRIAQPWNSSRAANGLTSFSITCTTASWSFPPIIISRWEIIATTVRTAATGALWIATPSWASPC